MIAPPLPSHRDVIDSWPSIGKFAGDIGVAYNTAKHMRRRGSIPPEYFSAVVAAAKRRALHAIDFESLARAAPARPQKNRRDAIIA